jgi:hypothetical protein
MALDPKIFMRMAVDAMKAWSPKRNTLNILNLMKKRRNATCQNSRNWAWFKPKEMVLQFDINGRVRFHNLDSYLDTMSRFVKLQGITSKIWTPIVSFCPDEV